MVAVLSSIVPAHATGAAIAGALMENILGNMITKCLTPDGIDSDEASYEEALQYLNKIWLRSLDSRKEVDYNTLSSVYAQLLMQGVPCEIRSSRGAAQGYYIRGTGDMPVFNGKGRYGIKDKYFSDGSGNVFMQSCLIMVELRILQPRSHQLLLPALKKILLPLMSPVRRVIIVIIRLLMNFRRCSISILVLLQLPMSCTVSLTVLPLSSIILSACI